jgi:hypothetical protein
MMEKSVRVRIGKELPNQGKTVKELAEEAKWKKRGGMAYSEMPFRRKI